VVDEAGCFSSTAETGKDKNGPILAIACYIPNGTRSGSVWDGERADPNLDRTGVTENTHRGVILVRPSALNRERPVLLHEMLHAYHNLNLPDGVNNRAILFFYEKAKGLYPDDAYVMRNEREFFAVTASVFLSGKADDGATPVDIKEKQPDYYKFLVWLFGVNPDRPHSGTPLASAN
jgi:hypothetical protein